MEKGISFIRLPDSICFTTDSETITVDEKAVNGEVEIDCAVNGNVLEAFLTADTTGIREVVLRWKDLMCDAGMMLGDHWERGYGDLEWKAAAQTKVMPWYCIEDRAGMTLCYGVKVQPSAMCWWQVDGSDMLLHLDVRCGGAGVVLKGRKLKMADVIMLQYETADAFAATQSFCQCMCRETISYEKTVYGSNNWYYAYGNSSREEILGDTAYLAKMTEGNETDLSW